jgi:hypothetical protein
MMVSYLDGNAVMMREVEWDDWNASPEHEWTGGKWFC